jgi:formyl-CoA transferase
MVVPSLTDVFRHDTGEDAAMPGPYEGLFVLDAAQGIAGPYCGMLLAQAGARVVKLEPPKGDWSRGLTTRSGSHSVMHTAFNRGKEAVVLDLTSPQDQARAAKLAARADVLIEAFRPGVAARIGLGPEAAKPDAVCISISGFGQEGPYRERPCTDGVAQAYGGLVACNVGADGIPHRLTTLPVDVFSGLAAFAAAQSALAEQARDRQEGKPPGAGTWTCRSCSRLPRCWRCQSVRRACWAACRPS